MFEPTHAVTHAPDLAAAHLALAAVNPALYARTRNALGGAVTRLSPYITHSLLTIPDCVQALSTKHKLTFDDKLIFEFAWREFFHHVWGHLGDKILHDIRTPIWPGTYARELPEDITQARTGVPVIDQTVRDLYATGYLHNHARMWLASYVVHLRKVHWRAGADWLYGHLLDGDLASNHLSWQWVAGTGSHKPYLFNAENVERYAPPHWHSRGSVVDASYEELDRIARSPRPVASGNGVHAAEPPLLSAPPAGLFTAPDASALRGRAVRLFHPWAMADADMPGVSNVAVVDSDFHQQWPWSAARWRFVATRLQAASDLRWCGTANTLVQALSAAQVLHGVDSPHLSTAFAALNLRAPSLLLPWPENRCASFSQFWARATKGLKQAGELAQI